MEAHECPKCETKEYCKTMTHSSGIYMYKCEECGTKWEEGS